jgi:hypothetical protein
MSERSNPTKPQAAEPGRATAKRVALTLRLDPRDWLRLKTLAAELSIARGRQVSAHAVMEAALLRVLDEKGDGLAISPGDDGE